MGYKLSRKPAEERDSEGETEDESVATPASSDAERETPIQARQRDIGRQSSGGDVLQRASTVGGVSTEGGESGSLQRSYVDFEQGPDRRALSERYGMAVEDGQASTLQRLEDDFGTDRVEGWVDEGMTVGTMGKPRDMQAFRERQVGRSDEIPTDIERQNEASVYRNATQDGGPAGDTSVPDVVRGVVSSPGQSLDGTIQREMESKTGDSFGDVRIHTGPQAAAAAEQINARAFTVGNHVAFNRGEYQPDTTDGKRVLAHELTHVRQQREGAVSMLPKEGALQIDPDPALEREAEETADAVVSAEPTTVTRMGAEMHVQRAPDAGPVKASVTSGAAAVQREAKAADDAPREVDDDDDAPREVDDDDDAPREVDDDDDAPREVDEEDEVTNPAADEIPEQIRKYLTDIKMLEGVPPPILEALESDDFEGDEFLELFEDLFEYWFEETEEGQEFKEKLEELQEKAEEKAEELWEEHTELVIGGVIAVLGGMYVADIELPEVATEWIEENAELTYEGDSVVIEFDEFEYEGVPFDPDEWGGRGRIAYELSDDDEVEAIVDYRDTEEEQYLDVTGTAEGENYEIKARYLDTEGSVPDDEPDDGPTPAGREFLLTEGGTLFEVTAEYEGDDYDFEGGAEYIETEEGDVFTVGGAYEIGDYEIEGEYIETDDGTTLTVAGEYEGDDTEVDVEYEETPDGTTIAVAGEYEGDDYTAGGDVELVETEDGNTIAVTGEYEGEDHELTGKYVSTDDEETLSLGGEVEGEERDFDAQLVLADIRDSISLLNAQAAVTQETEDRLLSARAEFENTPEGRRYLAGGEYETDDTSAELELEHMPEGNRWMLGGERETELEDLDLDLTLGGEAESLPESLRLGTYANVAGEFGEAGLGLDMVDMGDEREFKAQLDAGIQATDRLKLNTQNQLRRTPAGTTFESELEARYQAADNLQGYLKGAHQRGPGDVRSTDIRGGLNYNADQLWFNLEGSYSDEEGAGVEAGLIYRW